MRICLSGDMACTGLVPCTPCGEALILHVFSRALAAAGFSGSDPMQAMRFFQAYNEARDAFLGSLVVLEPEPPPPPEPTLNAGEETLFGGDWPLDVAEEDVVPVNPEDVLREVEGLTEPTEEALAEAAEEAIEEAHKRVGGAPLDPAIASAVKVALAGEEDPSPATADGEGDTDTKET